jgi:hypothetical protein
LKTQRGCFTCKLKRDNNQNITLEPHLYNLKCRSPIWQYLTLLYSVQPEDDSTCTCDNAVDNKESCLTATDCHLWNALLFWHGSVVSVKFGVCRCVKALWILHIHGRTVLNLQESRKTPILHNQATSSCLNNTPCRWQMFC